MARFTLTRRTMLRGLLGGAAVSIALPPLEAMMDAHGLAYADGPPPLRFGLWFWGNGIRRAQWLPQGTGTAWTPRNETEPLAAAAIKPYVSPVTGFEIKTATHPHHSGMTGILTGMRYHQNGTTRDTIVSSCAGPTLDQVAGRGLNDRALLVERLAQQLVQQGFACGIRVAVIDRRILLPNGLQQTVAVVGDELGDRHRRAFGTVGGRHGIHRVAGRVKGQSFEIVLHVGVPRSMKPWRAQAPARAVKRPEKGPREGKGWDRAAAGGHSPQESGSTREPSLRNSAATVAPR